MSYKYLYGFTNEPSYDFSKVIYFGKQDRCESALNRIPEHYSVDDPNHEALQNAKYVLVAPVDTISPLGDLEAYFIQSYKPPLNNVYNSEKGSKEKLNTAELAKIKESADKLTWILINNSSRSAKDVDLAIKEIKKRNEIIKSATYIFQSEEEIMQTPCNEVISKINNETAIIQPQYENSLLCPLFIVTATNSSVFIDYYTYVKSRLSRHYKELPYQKVCNSMEIPELNLVTKPLITHAKSYFSDEFKETDELALAEELLFGIWFNLLFFISRKLISVEPAFTANPKLGDIRGGIDHLANLNGGFHSLNWGLINGISKLLHTDRYPDEYEIRHFSSLFNFEDDVNNISSIGIVDFVYDYASEYADMTENDIMAGQTTYKDWILNNCGYKI